MKTNKTNEVYPFGKITDYLSVSQTGESDKSFELTDGTTHIKFNKIKLGFSSNMAKPYEFKAGNTRIYLTHKQVEILFTEYLRYTSETI